MNNTGIKTRVLNEIYDIAKENNVEKLFLFGSRARGDYKPTSDIDLAFIGGNSSNFILSVDEDTYTLLKFDIIDLSKSSRIPPPQHLQCRWGMNAFLCKFLDIFY